MEKSTLGELADLCGGRLLRGTHNEEILDLSIDSRIVERGQLFLCLKGERFDGHDFAEDALKKGAAGVIGHSERLASLTEKVNQHAGLVAVDDTLAALHRLAHRYRLHFDIPLVAVTGSCGKTTTKDMLAGILEKTRKTVKTKGNLNNLIGAPLMLLRIDSDTEAAVIEIASNAPGEIDRLARTVSPTAALITTIDPVHLEGFGTLEGVFKEKSSVLSHIRPGGFAAVNEEDVPVERIRSMVDGKIITFGFRDSADVFACDIRQDIRSGTGFLLNGEDELRIPLLGKHNVLNALAAISCAAELGADANAIRDGLLEFPAASMRMELGEYRGALIINDAYNANPHAMREAISTVMALPAERIIFALGDMLELGRHADVEHYSLGEYIGRAKPDLLYLTGDFQDRCREGALKVGMQSEKIVCCADTEEIANSLRYILRSGDLLLVKGSRGMQMERVVQLLVE